MKNRITKFLMVLGGLGSLFVASKDKSDFVHFSLDQIELAGPGTHSDTIVCLKHNGELDLQSTIYKQIDLDGIELAGGASSGEDTIVCKQI